MTALPVGIQSTSRVALSNETYQCVSSCQRDILTRFLLSFTSPETTSSFLHPPVGPSVNWPLAGRDEEVEQLPSKGAFLLPVRSSVSRFSVAWSVNRSALLIFYYRKHKKELKILQNVEMEKKPLTEPETCLAFSPKNSLC